MNVSIDRLKKGINELDEFNSSKGLGLGTTRILFTEEEIKARNYIKKVMEEVGLVIEEDSIGNIFGSLVGRSPELAAVWSGSHIDTVYNAGKFDGMVGVISAIEALRSIKESGIKVERTIKAVVYTSEEPTRFGLSCLGSRALAGRLNKEDLKILKDDQGNTLEEVLESLAYNLSEFDKVKKDQNEVYASVELHIEQGAILEREEIKIGIVESICAPTNLQVKVKGVQEHAGSTPMNVRKDAMVATALMISQIEELVNGIGGKHTVGTVGRVEVFPNAANVIPGEVCFTIDIRDSLMENKDTLLIKIKELFKAIEESRDVEITYEVLNHDSPRACSSEINQVVKSICKETDIPYHNMVSGAYHDSIFICEFAPTSMIFVPSKNGISHHHLEWTDFEDIEIGTNILAESLVRLASSSH